MKKRIILPAMLLSIAAAGIATTQLFAETPKIESDIVSIPEVPKAEDVVASVEDYSLTWGELSKDVEMLLEMVGEDIPADQKSNLKEIARQRIVQTFIVDSLVQIAAAKENVTVTPELREKALAEFEREQGVPFETALAQLPPSIANHNRKSFELRLLEMALLETVVFKDLKVDQKELDKAMAEVTSYREKATEKIETYHKAFTDKTMTVEDAVKADPDLFPPQVHVEISEDEFHQLPFPPAVLEAIKSTPEGALTKILTIDANTEMDATLQGFFMIEKKPSTSTAVNPQAKALATIEDLKKQLDEGADFATLAKEHSACPSGTQAGGDLGEFTRGMMVKPFEDAAFTQPIGEVGPVVKTDFGYHLIKVTARDDAADTVTASHILIRPEGQGYKFIPVMAVLPNLPPQEDVANILLEELKVEAAAKYFDSLRKSIRIQSTLYPSFAK